jgi:Bax protein
MSKKEEKTIFSSYRSQLIYLAKLYGVVEIKSYARSSKRLTTSQLELLLIKNKIKLPENRSNSKIIAKQELKEKTLTNIYLSICFLFFIAALIGSRPYIKSITDEVKFAHITGEYSQPIIKKELKKEKKKEATLPKEEKTEEDLQTENTISLNSETTLNLFSDLEYTLEQVRNGQQVKPVYFTKLPKDLKTLGNTEKKKELFIQIVLPLILAENEKILEDREKLFKILEKSFNSIGERVWLKRRFKEYKIDDSDLAELKTRMDIIPVSLAIAQAAIESGWGTSRFALEGNALFGQWTWGKKGIEPKQKDSNKKFKILNFQILRASVRAYKNNLNTNNGYKEFREARALLRQNDEKITGLKLAKYLYRYAATGKKYTASLEKSIKMNSLDDFDEARLLTAKGVKGVDL